MTGQPKLRDDLLSREVDDELLLYDAKSGEVHVLNPTAAAIAELCDGNTTVSAIADEILSVLSADPAAVRADVARIIGELLEKDLVEKGG